MKPIVFARSRRRVHVVLYVLALLFLYPLLQENLPTLAFVIFLSFSPVYWLSGRVISTLFDGEPLDERDQQVTGTGLTHAYWILAASLIVSAGVGVFDGYLWGPVEQLNRYFLLNDDVLFNFWPLLLVAAVLPACVVSWLEPDPLPETARERSAARA